VSTKLLIAIVDDDESVRDAAINLFRSMGLGAIAFESAETFLGSGSIDEVSCLVLDVQMPGMDGLRLQSHLTSIGRNIPIIFVTGYAEDSARARALESGAICFLTKPFSEGDLLSGLHSALESSDQ
jgi:FixJ family two-component response regulator